MSEKREILTITPPAPEWIERLKGLYALWDEPNATGVWAHDIERRLSATSEESGSLDTFYLSPHHSAKGEQVASALDVSRSPGWPGLGIVHRVFTHPAARRKGFAGALLDAAKRDFRRSRGRLLTVVAPSTGAAAEFYRSQGFQEAVRAKDGEALFGWAARGRHVREALLRFLKHGPASWREATPGDWAALVAYSAMPGGRPDAVPSKLIDHQWIEIFEKLRAAREGQERPEGAGDDEEPLSLEVAESRHGYLVAARASGGAPEWLRELAPGKE